MSGAKISRADAALLSTWWAAPHHALWGFYYQTLNTCTYFSFIPIENRNFLIFRIYSQWEMPCKESYVLG